MIKHIPKRCQVIEKIKCRDEATQWIGVSPNTFYICSDHAARMTNEDYEMPIINLETHVVEFTEVAEYACSTNCDICNS